MLKFFTVEDIYVQIRKYCFLFAFKIYKNKEFLKKKICIFKMLSQMQDCVSKSNDLIVPC